jgi:hypothetical protein
MFLQVALAALNTANASDGVQPPPSLEKTLVGGAGNKDSKINTQT